MKRSALVRVIRGAVLGLLLVSFAAAPAAATVTVSGHVKLGNTGVPDPSQVQVTFTLTGCIVAGMNTPHVVGVTNFVSASFSVTPQADGSWSATTYGNDVITCDVLGNSQWRVGYVYKNNSTSSATFFIPDGGAYNLDTATPSAPAATVYTPLGVVLNPPGRASQSIAGPLADPDGFVGNLTGNVLGNVTGNVSGSAGSVTGNAATATALAADPADCSGNNFSRGIDASGIAQCLQPAFSNLSGVATKGQQHMATVYNDQANAYVAGFAQSLLDGSNTQIGNAASPTKKAQFDVSNVTAGQTRTINVPDANSTTVQSITSSASQWITSMSAQGVFTKSQPAFTDISGTATKVQQHAATAYTDQANAFTGNQTIGANGAANILFINGPAASNRTIEFDTGSLARWIIRVNNTAEGGANAGSDLDFVSRDDSGAIIGSALLLNRATRLATFGVAPLIPGITDTAADTHTCVTAPGTPASGKLGVYCDSTNKVLSSKNDAGTVSNTVVPSSAGANQFASSVSAAGVVGYAQPAFTNISGVSTKAQSPATDVYTDQTNIFTLDQFFKSGRPWYDVMGFGAHGDGQRVTDASITSGTNALTTASSGLFTVNDVGKVIIVDRAGAAGAQLVTTVSGFVNANSITLTANAGSTVGPTATVTWGTDDSSFVNNAVTAAGAGNPGCVLFPIGRFMLSAITVPEAGLCLAGSNMEGTVLYAGASMTAQITKTTNTAIYGIQIRNMTLDGNLLATDNLKIVGAKGPVITDLHIARSANGGEGSLFGDATAGAVFYEAKLMRINCLYETGDYPTAANAPLSCVHFLATATDNHAEDIICKNCLTAGYNDGGGNNSITRQHSYPFPTPTYSTNYGSILGSGAIAVQLYSDNVTTAGTQINGNKVKVVAGRFYWGSANAAYPVEVVSGKTGLVIAGNGAENSTATSFVHFLGSRNNDSAVVGNSPNLDQLVVGTNSGGNQLKLFDNSNASIAATFSTVDSGSGGNNFNIDPTPAAGQAAAFRLCRSVNSTGGCNFTLFKGDNTTTQIFNISTAGLVQTGSSIQPLTSGTGQVGTSGNPYNGAVYGDTTGSNWVHGTATELLTLSTGGTTTDTTANLLPANSIIEAVVARVTTTITTATSWQIGDPTTAGRFSAANATMTAGTTQVGMVHVDQTGAAGPKQTAAAKVRVTTTGTPGAGVIRITVFYRQFVPPTS